MKILTTTLTLLMIGALLSLAGCETGLEDPTWESDGPLGGLAGDAEAPDRTPVTDSRAGDDDLESVVADEPTGEIVIGSDLNIYVEVGELLEITFFAELVDIDPIDTTITVEALPEGASVDYTNGVLSWTPTPQDVGVHVVGFDLWDVSAERVMDAQRLVIEVVPGTSLIEVGI